MTMNVFRTLLVVTLCALWAALGINAARAQDVQDPKAAAIRDNLKRSVDEYSKAIEAAERDLESAFEDAIQKIPSSLDVEERVRRQTGLKNQYEAFLKEGAEPEDRAIRSASEKFAKSVQAAADECFDAHTQAAERLDRLGDLESAALVLRERTELLVTSGHWLPPIPDYVGENITALRAHRPRFSQDLERELNAVVRASQGKDRLRFRRAIDAAISATKATRKKGEPPGNPNCREDFLLVLNTLRKGLWDLSALEFHIADHRKRQKRVGLPGLEYR
ncbi:MAG: hypothetical protein RL885_32535 [Planctomycetota bacterium]